jgi:hypothetical protein
LFSFHKAIFQALIGTTIASFQAQIDPFMASFRALITVKNGRELTRKL